MIIIHVDVFGEVEYLLLWIMLYRLTLLTMTSNTDNVTRPVVEIWSAHHGGTVDMIWKTLLAVFVKSHVLVC